MSSAWSLERPVFNGNLFQRKVCDGLKEHDSMNCDSGMVSIIDRRAGWIEIGAARQHQPYQYQIIGASVTLVRANWRNSRLKTFFKNLH